MNLGFNSLGIYSSITVLIFPTGSFMFSVYPTYLTGLPFVFLNVPNGTSGLKVIFNSSAFLSIALTFGWSRFFSINVSASFINSLFVLKGATNLFTGASVSWVPNSALREWDRWKNLESLLGFKTWVKSGLDL